MLYTLLGLALIAFKVRGSEDDDHDSHDHDHDHDHEYADCECVTGVPTDDLDCDGDEFDEELEGVQHYLTENNCKQYCDDGDYTGTNEAGFICLQTWFLLGQFHDYCVSGSVNESLFHDYLDVCPDCAQEFFYYEGAPACDEDLNCTASAMQEDAIDYVLDNCIDSCEDPCPAKFVEVEGYHRICDHDDISEEFDEAFDENPWKNTVCSVTESHCNVEEEEDHKINCSSPLNRELYMIKMDGGYDDLDLHDFHDHDHSSAFNYYICTVFIISVTSVLSVIFV